MPWDLLKFFRNPPPQKKKVVKYNLKTALQLKFRPWKIEKRQEIKRHPQGEKRKAQSRSENCYKKKKKQKLKFTLALHFISFSKFNLCKRKLAFSVSPNIYFLVKFKKSKQKKQKLFHLEFSALKFQNLCLYPSPPLLHS